MTTWAWTKQIVEKRLRRLHAELERASDNRRRYELRTTIKRWEARLQQIAEREAASGGLDAR